MAILQVILQGARIASYDIYDYPLVLQFGNQKTYESATWFIPSFQARIPARRLSEIRVLQGPISVLIDGPDGFQSGPYVADWVRNYYPRGKDCAFIRQDGDFKAVKGIAVTVVDETLVIEQLEAASPASG